MKYTRKVALFAFALFLTACNGNLKAENFLQFSIDGGNTFGDSFVIDAGSPVNVVVFLSETAPDTTLNDIGLFGFGLTGVLSSGAAGEIADASPESVFNGVFTDQFSETSINWDVGVLSGDFPTGSNIALGSFQFDPLGDGVSTLTFSDIDPNGPNWLAGDGVTELDSAIFGAGSTRTFQLNLSTTAVPEPAAATMLAAASLAMFVRRRRMLFA